MLIEPQPFIAAAAASSLAQLPHQRDSNTSAVWPLADLGEEGERGGGADGGRVCVRFKVATKNARLPRHKDTR